MCPSRVNLALKSSPRVYYRRWSSRLVFALRPDRSGRPRPSPTRTAFIGDDALGLYVVADCVGGPPRRSRDHESSEQICGFVLQSTPDHDFLGARRDASHLCVPSVESAVPERVATCFSAWPEHDPSQRACRRPSLALLSADCYRRLGARSRRGASSACVRGAGQQLTETTRSSTLHSQQGAHQRRHAKRLRGKNVKTRSVDHKDYVRGLTRASIEVQSAIATCSAHGLHGLPA